MFERIFRWTRERERETGQVATPTPTSTSVTGTPPPTHHAATPTVLFGVQVGRVEQKVSYFKQLSRRKESIRELKIAVGCQNGGVQVQNN